MQLQNLMEDGIYSPRHIAAVLRTSRKEIGATLGLSADALSRKTRLHSPATQTRLREMVEILNFLDEHGSPPLAAYAWFRSSKLPGFGSTPEELVREGHAAWVMEYLKRVSEGGYA